MSGISAIRFDNRIAVVTGAGGSNAAADKVVAEIVAAGGAAVPNYDNIAEPSGARNLIQTAIDAYGRIDVLINNAGILRDKSLAKMDPADFASVVAVHLLGSAYCSQVALGHMQGQAYGRIVMTTLAAVAFLASEACELTGEVIAAGAGYLARVQIMESQGVRLAPADVTPEAVAANWEKIADMSGARPFDSAAAALAGAFLPN